MIRQSYKEGYGTLVYGFIPDDPDHKQLFTHDLDAFISVLRDERLLKLLEKESKNHIKYTSENMNRIKLIYDLVKEVYLCGVQLEAKRAELLMNLKV